ncbi:LOW QUALITY PROTEIN: hypothetical protein ACHAW6_006138, partial [Cyclotella cf. meneghiniana]
VYYGSYAYPCDVVGIVAAFSYCCFGGEAKRLSWEPCGRQVMADLTSSHTHYTYTFLGPDYYCNIPDMLKEHDIVIENGVMIVETLLIHGRMRSEDVLACVWDVVKCRMNAENDDAASKSSNTDDKLTEAGCIEAVKPITTVQEMIDLQDKEKEAADVIRSGEFQFNVDIHGTIVASDKKKHPRPASLEDTKALKRIKQSSHLTGNENDVNDYGRRHSQSDNPEIISLLEPLHKFIPPGSVYHFSTGRCDTSLCAMIIGCMNFKVLKQIIRVMPRSTTIYFTLEGLSLPLSPLVLIRNMPHRTDTWT